MFQFKKEKRRSQQFIELNGSIDENINLESMIEVADEDVVLNLKGISRINSIGIASWIKFFNIARKKKHRLKFVECSPVVVETFNMISNFACGGEVASIYIPFVCGTCAHAYIELHKVSDLKKVFPEAPASKCVKCQKPSSLDDNPSEYLGFISQQK